LRLAGKVAVITGAGSGIGRAAALLFAAEGAAVLAGVYEADGPEPLPSPITAVPCDVTRDEDTARLFRAAVDLHGGLDILVNNAGIESPGTVTETTDEQWQRLIDVNLKGQFLCARQAVPLMLARGRGSSSTTPRSTAFAGIIGSWPTQHRRAAWWH
jgi:NAD(P)-dependent dehydrogenase (short-subunit alcohol dehydrogenase family)